jgi:hypothetical protein
MQANVLLGGGKQVGDLQLGKPDGISVHPELHLGLAVLTAE